MKKKVTNIRIVHSQEYIGLDAILYHYDRLQDLMKLYVDMDEPDDRMIQSFYKIKESFRWFEEYFDEYGS
jgi:hypothetical protein